MTFFFLLFSTPTNDDNSLVRVIFSLTGDKKETPYCTVPSYATILYINVVWTIEKFEKSGDIDPQEAQQTLEIAEAALRKAEGKRQTIEANLALRRARTRVEAINAIS
jgi:F0F1-type ATP synthase epsilon subunit